MAPRVLDIFILTSPSQPSSLLPSHPPISNPIGDVITPINNVQYDIYATTSERGGSSTAGNITLTIHGDPNSDGPDSVSYVMSNLGDNGQTAHYVTVLPFVGVIQYIEVESFQSDRWNFDLIEISVQGATYSFYFYGGIEQQFNDGPSYVPLWGWILFSFFFSFFFLPSSFPLQCISPGSLSQPT